LCDLLILTSCRADLANLVNEAALLAGRKNKVLVEKFDFIQAVERSIAVIPSLSLCVCVCLGKVMWVQEICDQFNLLELPFTHSSNKVRVALLV
jgi:hypothetical protein